jgi:hypothetical protein
MHLARQILAVCIILLGRTSLAAQAAAISVYGGWTELTNGGPGLMAHLQPTEFPLAAVAQIGVSGTGMGLDISWVRPADQGGLVEPRLFLSAGLGYRFHRDTAQTGWGDLVAVGGVRVPYPGGGPVFDLGLGVFRTLGGSNKNGYTAGLAGRFMFGWRF